MFCGRCGRKIEANTVYCPYCGNRIISNEVFNKEIEIDISESNEINVFSKIILVFSLLALIVSLLEISKVMICISICFSIITIILSIISVIKKANKINELAVIVSGVTCMITIGFIVVMIELI